VEVIRLSYQAARANSFAEQFVGTARREWLDHLLVFGRRHLERVLSEFLEHYHPRPHQGAGSGRPADRPMRLHLLRGRGSTAAIALGGLLHECSRAE
jgi:putative transposase